MICLQLLMHWARRALSLALARAGSSRPARIAMMVMTTSSSIRVKAADAFGVAVFIVVLSGWSRERCGDRFSAGGTKVGATYSLPLLKPCQTFLNTVARQTILPLSQTLPPTR